MFDFRRDDRGNLPGVPPSEFVAHPAIRSAMEARRRAEHAAQGAYRDAVALEQARPRAVQRDNVAAADAMQAGKPDPGEKNVIEHDKQIRTAQRRAEASKIVAERSVDALREAMADHGAEWAALAAKHLKSTRKKWAEEIDRLAVTQQELASAAAIVAYIEDGRYKPVGGLVPLRRTGDHTATVADVLDSLRLFGAPVDPRPAPVGGMRLVGEAA